MKLLPRLFALFAMVLAAASPAAAEDITLKAADGTALHAEYNKVNGEGAGPEGLTFSFQGLQGPLCYLGYPSAQPRLQVLAQGHVHPC